MENIKECYSLKDVCEELHISRDSSYKSERDQYRKKFEDFLLRISVPVDCFKNDSNEWCFNENGKELFLDFCNFRSYKYSPENSSTVYRDLRKKITHAECEEKYNWIIERICSNLQYNIDTSEFPEEYPNPEEVYCTFREHCRTAQPLVEDVFKLPGVMHLLKSIRYQRNYDLFEQASEKIAHAQPDDIIFIDTLMDEEFVKIYSDFRTAQEEAIKKWFHYLSEFKKLRDLEQEEFKKTLPPEGEETINMLIQRSILSIDDLPVEKLSYRLTTTNNSMIKAIIEMIAIAPEIEPYLTSLEEIGNFSKRLSSEELYNKISAQLKKDNLNPF